MIDETSNKSQSLKGVNWGQYQLQQNGFNADYNGKPIFNIPWKQVQNSQVLNKNDIVMDLNDDLITNQDTLCEIRIYIPPKQIDQQEKESESEKEEKDENKENEQNAQKQLANVLNEEIVKLAEISEYAGNFIAKLTDVPLFTPRGKYTIDLYEQFARFHGSTFSYKIEYKNLIRGFLLPKPGDTLIVFALQLQKPLRQGNTQYPFIVMQFKKNITQNVKINFQQEELSKVYDGKLKENYSGPLHDTISKLFKIIVGTNIIIPGEFKTSNGEQSLKCSVKALEGNLFLLQKSIIFVNKPVVYHKIEEIAAAEFFRIGGGISNKLFDLGIKLKNNKIERVTFVGIERKELENIQNYFQKRGIKVIQGSNTNYGDIEEEAAVENEKLKQNQSVSEEEDEDDDESFNAESDQKNQSSSDRDSDIDEDLTKDELKKKKVKKQNETINQIDQDEIQKN